jgi:hypothetical protein
MDPALYLERYLDPLAATAGGAPAEVPALDLHQFDPEPSQPTASPDLTLAQLYAAGVECGHLESRLELKRRVTVLAGQIERRVAAVTGALRTDRRARALRAARPGGARSRAPREATAHRAAAPRAARDGDYAQAEAGRMRSEIGAILVEVGRLQAEFGRIDDVSAEIFDTVARMRDQVEGIQAQVAAMQAAASAMRARGAEMQQELARVQLQAGEMQRHNEELASIAQQVQAHADHLGGALGAARARIVELETSTAWRMTQPLRAVGHRLKILLARLRASGAGLRLVPTRLGIAMSILRNDGPAALWRRVRAKFTPAERFQPAQAPALPEPNGGTTASCRLAFRRRASPRPGRVTIIIRTRRRSDLQRLRSI